MALIAGIDSSTQSCKVVVRDLETGRLVRAGRASHPAGTEIDPVLWWDALLAAVLDAGGLEGVVALSIGGQQHGCVCLNAAGEVVRPALLWNDTRSASSSDDLAAELGAEAWATGSGSLPVASFTVTKLRWMRDHEPANVDATVAVALPHDYLTWRLLGHGHGHGHGRGPGPADFSALITDRSDASGTGYWSPATGAYRLDLLEHAFGRQVIVPRVLGPVDSAGETAAFPGIPAGILVGPGAGDNAGAALGLGAGRGDVVISIGTSGTVFAVSDTTVADASGTVAGFADATGLFLPLVATLNAARVLTAAGTLLGADHDRVAELAMRAAPGSGGLVLLPYLEGERTPNLPTVRGSIHGLTLANATPPNLARAMVEGMLCGLADGLDAIASRGVEVERILLIGGGARNAAVQRIAPEVFGLPVTVPPASEYVADGAARQAAWVHTGEQPEWPLGPTTRFDASAQPVIREQYAAAGRALGY
ncbi:xylulokinase [Marisediminicola antarctica]|uniref:Xylulose kinase n=1 Tax=Marisediminicola antarctica TaxID=674079 RepID=A0A7L5ADT4_9MICO|nr:xylulokinase [Marisediminicola antarctica]QHO68383.1 xylulokinase [Marisediminicola antarctica]